MKNVITLFQFFHALERHLCLGHDGDEKSEASSGDFCIKYTGLDKQKIST